MILEGGCGWASATSAARLASWIGAQPVFFVATTPPLAADGLMNVFPRGVGGSFQVLDEPTFGYVDLTGSGIETVAHLRENGRIWWISVPSAM